MEAMVSGRSPTILYFMVFIVNKLCCFHRIFGGLVNTEFLPQGLHKEILKKSHSKMRESCLYNLWKYLHCTSQSSLGIDVSV